MRDIVPKVSANRPQEQRPIGPDALCKDGSHCEMRRTNAPGEIFMQVDLPHFRKMTPDMDEMSVSSQDSAASNSSAKSDVPSPVQSYRQYLGGYSTLKFKPVKLAKPEAEDAGTAHVDGVASEGKPHANSDDARVHKAEIVIQVKPQPITSSRLQECQQVPVIVFGNPQAPPLPPPPPPPPSFSALPALASTTTTLTSMPPPPPPPPAMPHVLPAKIHAHATVCGSVRSANHTPMIRKDVQRDLKTCLMDELKAKHAPREYPFHGEDVERGALARRTSEPINTANTMHAAHQNRRNLMDERKQVKPPLPAYPPRRQHLPPQTMQRAPNQPLEKKTKHAASNGYNSLPRRWSEQHQIATMLANPEAQTVTKVPATRRDAPVDRDDPSVKKLVYATLRNYVGAYNHHANRIAAQHGNVVQDKGVSQQINSILASGNLGHLNGRTNPKESE